MLRQEIPAGMLSGISVFNHEWQGKILQSGLILACELLEFCHSVSKLCSNGTEIQPETSEIVPLPSERTWLILLQHPNLFVGCCGEGNLWISTDVYRYLQIPYLLEISIARLECCKVPKNLGFAQEEHGWGCHPSRKGNQQRINAQLWMSWHHVAYTLS